MEITYDELAELVTKFNDALNEVKTPLMEFLSKAEENYKAFDLNNRKADYKDTHCFDDMVDSLKEIEGPDFDVYETTFDDYDKAEDKATYIANITASLKQQIDKLKEATGAETVEVKDDGEMEIKADSQPIAEAEGEADSDNDDEVDKMLEKAMEEYKKVY